MNKYKPQLIVISISDLINHIKIKANSLGPTCNSAYAEEQACGIWADGTDGAGGSSGGGSWGGMCVQIGPLLGCEDDIYCGALAPVL